MFVQSMYALQFEIKKHVCENSQFPQQLGVCINTCDYIN